MWSCMSDDFGTDPECRRHYCDRSLEFFQSYSAIISVCGTSHCILVDLVELMGQDSAKGSASTVSSRQKCLFVRDGL